ncbi:MAG: MFS transporter [Oscillospiraceae bacterium]|jgi:GPH family glycoside/pentoside/hexuronide:cation symporter|nr:MFS transporter [Oscillospiraceae bacterium]
MAKPSLNNIGSALFGAEKHSAAAMDRQKLSRHQELAARFFHTPQLSVKETLLPAFSSMGRGLANRLNTHYIKIYLFSILKFDMTYMVVIEMLIGIYDILNNPLMGIVYDRTRTRWGKARPYVVLFPLLYFATIAAMFCTRLIFNNDNPLDQGKIMYVFVILFLRETFSTIYGIPLDGILSLQTPNPQDRMKVGLWQTWFDKWGGDFVAGMVLPMLDLTRRGILKIQPASIFAVLGFITAGIGGGSTMAMAMNVRERVVLPPQPTDVTKSIFYLLKNKYALRNFVATFFSSWWGTGGYSWDVVTQTEIFGGTLQAFWTYMPRQVMQLVALGWVEKFKRFFGGSYRKTILLTRSWDFVSFVIGGVLGSRKFALSRWWLVGLIFAVFDGVNVANDAPSTVLEQEIGREINDYTEYMTGDRPDGTINLLTGYIGKLTAPLNTMMTLAVLRWSGYDKTKGEGLTNRWRQEAVMQNYTMYSRVFLLYMCGSFLPHLVNMIPLVFYDLEGKKKEEMYIALNERRALMAKADNSEIGALAEMLAKETE